MQRIALYQVLPRLYDNENSANVPNGTLAENGCGKFSNFTDKRLTRLRNFGFTHIWYTGVIEHATTTDYSSYGIKPNNTNIVKGKAGSPYAIKDYYDINPDLADDPNKRLEEFSDLLKRTHKAGLKVIIDFVPNHVSRQYCSDASPKGVRTLGENDDKTKSFDTHNNFYYLQGQRLEIRFADEQNPYIEEPARATGNDCFTSQPGICDWYETVKLNYGIDYQGGGTRHFYPTPATWIQMTDILRYWATLGVDGFRCDMAEMVPSDFWRYAIGSLKNDFPEIIFIAEVYNPSLYREYIHHGGFDYLYDKVGLYDCLRAIICHGHPASSLTNCWQAVDDIRSRMLSFLENHDEQRIASDFFAGNPQKAVPAMAVALCWGTNPFMIYAGQEIGERGMDAEGFSGRDGRTSIFDYFSPSSLRKLPRGPARFNKQEKELYDTYKRLVLMQNTSKALREGNFYDLTYANMGEMDKFNANRHYAFLRSCDDEHVITIVNFSESPANIWINIPKHAFEHTGLREGSANAIDLISGKDVSIQLSSDKPIEVRLASYGVACLSVIQKKTK